MRLITYLSTALTGVMTIISIVLIGVLATNEIKYRKGGKHGQDKSNRKHN